MTLDQNAGRLKVVIKSTELQSKTPKELQILNTDLSLNFSKWIFDNEWSQILQPGIYMVRLNITSGKQLDKIVDIKNNEECAVSFEIESLDSNQERSSVYAAKGISKIKGRREQQYLTRIKEGFKSTKISLELHPYRFEQNFYPTDYRADETISEQGKTYTFDSPPERSLLVVEGPETKQYVICLPPGKNITCSIKLVDRTDFSPFQLSLSISTANPLAQTLLSLIRTGDIDKAKSLVRSEEAEELLFEKIKDPVSAAIGGYYLLKTGEIQRMYDWPNNLANWFPWMPDGPIIYAWQLIQRKELNEYTIQEIKKQLLSALDRGIPIYTEGLRLLLEGLTMCSYQFKREDLDVETALNFIRYWFAYADMSQETSTLVFPKAGTVRVS